MEGCVAVTDLGVRTPPAGLSTSASTGLPTRQALDLLGAPAHVLDLGCGAGTFLRAAADRGARVSGLDASPALLELARMYVPEAALTVGDLQALPYADAVRRRDELHLVLVRRRPPRGAARGRSGRQAGRSGARGRPRPARGERPARDHGRCRRADRAHAAAGDAPRTRGPRNNCAPPAWSRMPPASSRHCSSSRTRRRSLRQLRAPAAMVASGPRSWARSAWRRRSATP